MDINKQCPRVWTGVILQRITTGWGYFKYGNTAMNPEVS
jgi:hypothetical protein